MMACVCVVHFAMAHIYDGRCSSAFRRARLRRRVFAAYYIRVEIALRGNQRISGEYATIFGWFVTVFKETPRSVRQRT